MPRMDTEMAALVIQKIFRGYKTRLASIRADKQELIFLRMAADDLDGEDYAEQLEKETRQRRKHKQKEYERLYNEHTEQMRAPAPLYWPWRQSTQSRGESCFSASCPLSVMKVSMGHAVQCAAPVSCM